MCDLDQLILGDNQFFGINHMSQEKAQQLAERFNDMPAIFDAYRTAHSVGLRAFMLNSNEKAGVICDYFRDHRSDFPGLRMYPSIPYPHKYANLVAEQGIVGTMQTVLSGQSAFDVLGLAGKGFSLLTGDFTRILTMLVDVEMKIYRQLDFNVVYLQNIVTDLLLGLGFQEVFVEFCNHIEKKYRAVPGFLTMNVPRLAAYLEACGIERAAICGAVNQSGYLMSPDVESYENFFRTPQKYPVTAMSIFAGGAIPPKDAVRYVARQGIRSVVFGASTRAHMQATVDLAGELA
jgi:hypothetical protein